MTNDNANFGILIVRMREPFIMFMLSFSFLGSHSQFLATTSTSGDIFYILHRILPSRISRLGHARYYGLPYASNCQCKEIPLFLEFPFVMSLKGPMK